MSIYIRKNKLLFILTIFNQRNRFSGVCFYGCPASATIGYRYGQKYPAICKNGCIFDYLLCGVGIFSLSPIVTEQKW